MANEFTFKFEEEPTAEDFRLKLKDMKDMNENANEKNNNEKNIENENSSLKTPEEIHEEKLAKERKLAKHLEERKHAITAKNKRILTTINKPIISEREAKRLAHVRDVVKMMSFYREEIEIQEYIIKEMKAAFKSNLPEHQQKYHLEFIQEEIWKLNVLLEAQEKQLSSFKFEALKNKREIEYKRLRKACRLATLEELKELILMPV